VGIYLYLSTTNLDFLKSEKNGYTLQATFYNQNGEEIKPGVAQTTVGGEAGLFYMSLKILASNTGQVALTNLKLKEAHPAVFWVALTNVGRESPLQSNLAVGESNVLGWNTKRFCSTDAQCSNPEERCVNSNCLIDISNFLGQITFGATLEADYLDPQGVTQTTSTIINLPITFEQDSVLFRTSNKNYDTGWIAIDLNSDGTLEGYDYSGSSSLLSSCTSGGRILTGILTPENYEVVSSSGQIDICYPSGNKYVFKYYHDASTTAVLYNVPTEPYKSQNCGGLLPCQERYSVAVTPQSQTCGNDIKEGTELCDGTDLDGNDCASVMGEGYTGTLVCSSCTSWDTSGCTSGGGPTGNVKFRTSDLSYGSSSAILWNGNCDGTIESTETYGRYGGSYCTTSSYTICAPMNGYTVKIQPSNLGGWSWGTGDLCLYSRDSDSTQMRLCQVTMSSGGPCSIQGRGGCYNYDSDDNDKSAVSTSPTSINTNYEVSC